MKNCLKWNLTLNPAPQALHLQPTPNGQKTDDWEGLFLCLLNFDLLNNPNEPPRRKRRGISRKILNAPRGGVLNPRPPQAD
jgi:hypothetical protein